MTRELFVYWRVDVAAAAAAFQAVRTFHGQLSHTQPAVQARLYRRADESNGSVTLMETYATLAGFDDAQQADLLGAASQALARWARGERHVEVFDRMTG